MNLKKPDARVYNYLVRKFENALDAWNEGKISGEEFRDRSSAILGEAVDFVVRVSTALVAVGLMREKVISDLLQTMAITFYRYLEEAKKHFGKNKEK